MGPVVYLKSSNTSLNLASAMLPTKNNPDINAQLIHFSIMDTDYITSSRPKLGRRKYFRINLSDQLLKEAKKFLKKKERGGIRCWYFYALKQDN